MRIRCWTSRPTATPPRRDPRGAEAPRGPGRAGQLRHLMEADPFDLLDDQLCDPVPPLEPDGLARVKIDHDHFDLPTVPGIHGSRGIHHRHPAPGGQARTRVREGRVAVGQRQRDAGGQHRSLTGRQLGGLGRDQVKTGVPGVGVAGHRDGRVEPPQQHIHRRAYSTHASARLTTHLSTHFMLPFTAGSWDRGRGALTGPPRRNARPSPGPGRTSPPGSPRTGRGW